MQNFYNSTQRSTLLGTWLQVSICELSAKDVNVSNAGPDAAVVIHGSIAVAVLNCYTAILLHYYTTKLLYRKDLAFCLANRLTCANHKAGAYLAIRCH